MRTASVRRYFTFTKEGGRPTQTVAGFGLAVVPTSEAAYVVTLVSARENTYPSTDDCVDVHHDDGRVDPNLDARLPEPYARALELAAAGCSDEVLARSLGIDVAAVPTLLDIARAKAASAAPLTSNVDDYAAEQSGCDPDA